MRMTIRQLIIRKGLPFEATIYSIETMLFFEEVKSPTASSTFTDARTVKLLSYVYLETGKAIVNTI